MSRSKRSLSEVMGFNFIDFEFHLIEEYINHMESHFELELNTIEREFNEFKDSLEKEESTDYSDEYLNHIEDSFIDNAFMFRDVYTKNFRNAQIIQLYSFLEITLKRGCDRFSLFKKTEYKVDDLKGNNDIDKIKKFLKQSVKVDFSKLNPEWQFIDNFRQVRNLVVHHKSIIKNRDVENNKDKNFNNILNFSKGRFQLKQYTSLSNKHEIIFDNPIFLNEIILNIKNLIQKISLNEYVKNKPN